MFAVIINNNIAIVSLEEVFTRNSLQLRRGPVRLKEKHNSKEKQAGLENFICRKDKICVLKIWVTHGLCQDNAMRSTHRNVILRNLKNKVIASFLFPFPFSFWYFKRTFNNYYLTGDGWFRTLEKSQRGLIFSNIESQSQETITSL